MLTPIDTHTATQTDDRNVNEFIAKPTVQSPKSSPIPEDLLTCRPHKARKRDAQT
jgi:hypothetical protein